MQPIIIENIDNIKTILNNITSHLRLFALVGIVVALCFEHKKLYQFFTSQKKSRKELSFLLPRLSYVVGGPLAIALSRKITSRIFHLIGSVDTSNLTTNPEPTSYRPINLLWQTSGYTSLFSFIGFVIAGILITISAGDRRCINTAKTVYFITFLYILITAFVRYSI